MLMMSRSLIDSAYSSLFRLLLWKTDTPFVMVKELKIQRRTNEKSELISSGNQAIGMYRARQRKEEERRHVDAPSTFKRYLMLPERPCLIKKRENEKRIDASSNSISSCFVHVRIKAVSIVPCGMYCIDSVCIGHFIGRYSFIRQHKVTNLVNLQGTPADLPRTSWPLSDDRRVETSILIKRLPPLSAHTDLRSWLLHIHSGVNWGKDNILCHFTDVFKQTFDVGSSSSPLELRTDYLRVCTISVLTLDWIHTTWSKLYSSPWKRETREVREKRTPRSSSACWHWWAHYFEGKPTSTAVKYIRLVIFSKYDV